MSEFVEECRREWKRLGVPDPIAGEMAADLAADLAEAEADGVSAEQVLGSGAFDPRGFAASWASERGVIGPAATAPAAPMAPSTTQTQTQPSVTQPSSTQTQPLATQPSSTQTQPLATQPSSTQTQPLATQPLPSPSPRALGRPRLRMPDAIFLAAIAVVLVAALALVSRRTGAGAVEPAKFDPQGPPGHAFPVFVDSHHSLAAPLFLLLVAIAGLVVWLRYRSPGAGVGRASGRGSQLDDGVGGPG